MLSARTLIRSNVIPKRLLLIGHGLDLASIRNGPIFMKAFKAERAMNFTWATSISFGDACRLVAGSSVGDEERVGHTIERESLLESIAQSRSTAFHQNPGSFPENTIWVDLAMPQRNTFASGSVQHGNMSNCSQLTIIDVPAMLKSQAFYTV